MLLDVGPALQTGTFLVSNLERCRCPGILISLPLEAALADLWLMKGGGWYGRVRGGISEGIAVCTRIFFTTGQKTK